MSRLRHPLVAAAVTVLLTLPWLAVWTSGAHPGTGLTVLCSGLAILGGSFFALAIIVDFAISVRELLGLTGLAVRRAFRCEVPNPGGLE